MGKGKNRDKSAVKKGGGLSGAMGTSLGSYEYSPEWFKKQARKRKNFEAKCKRLSGPVRTRQLTEEELERVRKGETLDL